MSNSGDKRLSYTANSTQYERIPKIKHVYVTGTAGIWQMERIIVEQEKKRQMKDKIKFWTYGRIS
jgi:Na+-transporting NADH:ubiquinone oxidoreductase subunit NqrF